MRRPPSQTTAQTAAQTAALTARAAAAALVVALALVGCSSGDESTPEASTDQASETATTGGADDATADDTAALDAVAVEGPLGSAPTVTFEPPFEVSAPVARGVTPGDGEPLQEGQQLQTHYVAVSGADGSTLGSTYEAAPEPLTFGDPRVPTALTDVLRGQNVGARLLFAVPGQPATEATDGAPATEATPATILAIEILSARTVPTRAEGEPVEPAPGLPVVTLAEDGQPSIEVPEGATEPAELVVQPLIKGAGPVVEAGQTVTFQYSGWLFDGTPFDSSWENGSPFTTTIGTGSVIPGWDQGLVGQTVGSQVLLVIPPELGYGAEGSGDSIPPDSTLVFVVDILDAA